MNTLPPHTLTSPAPLVLPPSPPSSPASLSLPPLLYPIISSLFPLPLPTSPFLPPSSLPLTPSPIHHTLTSLSSFFFFIPTYKDSISDSNWSIWRFSLSRESVNHCRTSSLSLCAGSTLVACPKPEQKKNKTKQNKIHPGYSGSPSDIQLLARSKQLDCYTLMLSSGGIHWQKVSNIQW